MLSVWTLDGDPASDGGAALRAFLAGNNRSFMAELLTIDLERPWGVDAARGMTVLGSGTRCKWTSAQVDVAGFYAALPLAVGGVTRSAGAEISELEVTLLSGQWAFPNGVRLPLAAARGAFDGARVQLWRLFMPTWGDLSLGVLHWFDGYVADVEPHSLGAKLTVKDSLERLNLPLPRRVFQPACPYDLYGSACGATKTNHSATVLAGSTADVLRVNPGLASTDWALGSVSLTTGALAGLTMSVLSSQYVSNTEHRLTLVSPLPSVPATGDGCVLLLGCDKSYGAKGCALFSNLNRFGGFPFVPKPESVR